MENICTTPPNFNFVGWDDRVPMGSTKIISLNNGEIEILSTVPLSCVNDTKNNNCLQDMAKIEKKQADRTLLIQLKKLQDTFLEAQVYFNQTIDKKAEKIAHKNWEYIGEQYKLKKITRNQGDEKLQNFLSQLVEVISKLGKKVDVFLFGELPNLYGVGTASHSVAKNYLAFTEKGISPMEVKEYKITGKTLLAPSILNGYYYLYFPDSDLICDTLNNGYLGKPNSFYKQLEATLPAKTIRHQSINKKAYDPQILPLINAFNSTAIQKLYQDFLYSSHDVYHLEL